jgi:hypothetical protein
VNAREVERCCPDIRFRKIDGGLTPAAVRPLPELSGTRSGCVTAEHNPVLNCVPGVKDYRQRRGGQAPFSDSGETQSAVDLPRVSAQHSVISEQRQFAKPADRRLPEVAALRSLSSSSSAASMVPVSIRAATRASRAWIFTVITQLLAMCGLVATSCVFDEAKSAG